MRNIDRHLIYCWVLMVLSVFLLAFTFNSITEVERKLKTLDNKLAIQRMNTEVLKDAARYLIKENKERKDCQCSTDEVL